MARPRQTMTLPIKVAGLAPGEEAEVTVAAVDIGILNITGFKTPDPKDYFFGQRKLSDRDTRSLRPADRRHGRRSSARSTPAATAARGVEGNLPTQEPLALYSGVVRVDANGEAKVSFDLPAFNGSVRIMAAAWSKAKVGSAEAEVIVRDPVVVAGTLPRFLSLGDRSQMHIDIDNVEGEAGDYKLDLDIHGPLVAQADAMSKAVKLEAHQRTSVTIPVTAAGIGTASLDLRLTGPKLEVVATFRAWRHRRRARSLSSQRPSSGGRRQRDDIERSAGRFHSRHRIDIGCRLAVRRRWTRLPCCRRLERYPYGCSEQTVSRAMPLLYANRLASIEHLAIDPDLDGRIKQSIDRVMDRQDSNGAFGLWKAGGDDDDLWLDAFVSPVRQRAQCGMTQHQDQLCSFVVYAQPLHRIRPITVNRRRFTSASRRCGVIEKVVQLRIVGRVPRDRLVIEKMYLFDPRQSNGRMVTQKTVQSRRAALLDTANEKIQHQNQFPSCPGIKSMRQNFLFIVADDLNAWIGVLGRNPDVKTPNIDRLAKRAALFVNAYCSAPYCNASRMGLHRLPSLDHRHLSQRAVVGYVRPPPNFRRTAASSRVLHFWRGQSVPRRVRLRQSRP